MKNNQEDFISGIGLSFVVALLSTSKELTESCPNESSEANMNVVMCRIFFIVYFFSC